MANEDAVKTAMSDPTKQSRIAKFLTTLQGQDFAPILNAINGSEQDFTAQLNQVQARVAQINQLQTRITQRDQRVDQLTTEINQLNQRIAQRDATITELLAKQHGGEIM